MAEQVLCVRCGAPVEGANIYAFPGPRLQHDSPNDCIHALQRALQAEREKVRQYELVVSVLVQYDEALAARIYKAVEEQEAQ